MEHFTPHHLGIGPEHVAGNRGAGRLFFVPGSDGRARRLAEQFTDQTVVPSDRQLNVYLGRLQDGEGSVDVAAVATGMGCPSLDIVVSELILLGGRSFIRVGTAGSLRPDAVRAGDIVIATAAVRDEGTSERYAVTEYPAVADLGVVSALERAARHCGVAEHTFRGVVHSKDSLFAREMQQGARAVENQEYMRQLGALGVLATEMECAHLFVLAQVHSRSVSPLSQEPSGQGHIRAGAVLAIIGDDRPFVEPALAARAEQACMQVALRSALELMGSSGS